MNISKEDLSNRLNNLLKEHDNVETNLTRSGLITNACQANEAVVTKNGSLAFWSASNSTGRSPKDTYIVNNDCDSEYIDWTSENNLALDPQTFALILDDAMNVLKHKKHIFESDRVIGADSKYALKVKTISDKALNLVFADNMFREVPEDIDKSVFKNDDFLLLALPNDVLDKKKYQGLLRFLPNGESSDMAVVLDLKLRVGVVFGSSYLGSMKKLMFTAMNYYLTFEGVLPLHCSANEGVAGDSALLLGLSGTGKTTLSADPKRALLGDDEHGWSDEGIFNFENGCYAKMIDMTSDSEPEIFNAVMHDAECTKHGAILENVMIYPDGKIDFSDDRFTQNSRASYPLDFLTNIKKSSKSGNPNTILFLTADAYGVLPPISKLDQKQAMLWFLMGYTSKLAGTETGITEPKVAFSRFFGQPFMPCKPEVYAQMLGEKMHKFNTNVYLVNTGWSGGSYGTGSRIKLKYTRAMVEAAINGDLESVEFINNDLFHLKVPTSCPNVPSEILNPIDTWADKDEYLKTAQKLANTFSKDFDKSYSMHKIEEDVVAQCPGK